MPPRASILIIDDDENIRESLKLILQGSGFVVEEASNGRMGLEMVDRLAPDLVLCDVDMPVLNGHEVLAALRQNPTAAALPFIFLSGLADRNDVRSGMSKGADDYLTKPFGMQEVLDAVHTRLGRAASVSHYADQRHYLALEQAVESFKKRDDPVALLCVQIDRFAEIIAGLEPAAVPSFQKEILLRLQSHFSGGERVFPIPGEGHCVLLPAERPEVALPVALALLEKVKEPVGVGSRILRVSASIGISHRPTQGDSLDTLLGFARTAMALAVAEGGDSCKIAPIIDDFSPTERLELNSALHVAAERDELFLHYQPQVSLRDGRVIGVEALVRWKHGGRGVISPGVFIPWAEENGAILAIGEWVLRTACRQLRAWMNKGLPEITISVNLSGRQLRVHDLQARTARILEEEQVPARLLDLEVTETSLLRNTAECLELLTALRKTGITLSLDDFGTGYSSLDYLRQLPFDRLKIDKAFVSGLPGIPEKEAIVQSVIEMAGRLGMRILAEGVETAEELAFIRSVGCGEMQGYFFSRPLPPDACTELLKEGKRLP